jgi:Cytochrome c554 and c-prime
MMDVKHATYTIILWIVMLVPAQAFDDYWELPIPEQGNAPNTHHPLTQDLSPQRCALCHPKQFEQWQGSFHAKASSEGLVGQLPAYDELTQQGCLNCHAPRSEQHTLWDRSGIDALPFLQGVDCASCHVRSHKRYGPQKHAHTPHGEIERLELFIHSAFCAPCHQFSDDGDRTNGKLIENTYQEWLASPYAAAKQTCQYCHMPEKRHTFLGIHDPGTTRKGLKVEAQRQAQGIRVLARNAGAGHALPTYPTPRIRIIMEAVDNGKQRQEYVIHRHLIWNQGSGWTERSDTRLMPLEQIELTLNLMGIQQAQVVVVVEPDAFYHDYVYPSLFQLLGNDLDPEALTVLEDATKASGQTRYTLYQFKCDRWTGQEMPCKAIVP